MSRAFVKEESDGPAPRYSLPPREDPAFPLAAARALLAGANRGDSSSAEEATGFRWGDPELIPEMRQLEQEAIDRADDRLETLAQRYLRATEQKPT
jgi:hypothetical protein